jgi:hypothetical protein
MSHLLRAAAAAFCALLCAPASSLAWGNAGHREINVVAMRALPPDVPLFLQSSAAATTVEALGPEEDRLKGAGESWDRDDDPAHYVDVGDDGKIAGVVSLRRLPDDMEAYSRALNAAHTNPYRAGYLPYAIADGWEQLRQDFAYWRAYDYLSRNAATRADRQAFAGARALRESLIVYQIGIWGHFVADGSQPLHVTEHYDTRSHLHARFESDFVRAYVKTPAVAALLPRGGPRDEDHLLSQREILSAIGEYLQDTWNEVPQLYAIDKRGGFRTATREAIAFTTARVAAGARELRNLIVRAYDDSLYASVGQPRVPVRDILDGAAKVTPAALGARLMLRAANPKVFAPQSS